MASRPSVPAPVPLEAKSSARTLTDADVEALARRIVELQATATPPRFVDATTAAQVLNVNRDFVYRHAAELGASRLPSDGGQGRLRFDLERLLEQGDCPTGSAPSEAESRSGKPRNGSGRAAGNRQKVALLPVRGPDGG